MLRSATICTSIQLFPVDLSSLTFTFSLYTLSFPLYLYLLLFTLRLHFDGPTSFTHDRCKLLARRGFQDSPSPLVHLFAPFYGRDRELYRPRNNCHSCPAIAKTFCLVRKRLRLDCFFLPIFLCHHDVRFRRHH